MSTDDSRNWQFKGAVQNIGNPCFCTGPQNGEPYCPCMMRVNGVYKRGDRWVQPEKDLGEVNP